MVRTIALGTSALAMLAAMPALAQEIDGDMVKIGVLNDRSGLYADLAGEGSVIAARMAVEDFGAEEKGINVEIVSADHQNKPDVGSNIARQWIDTEGVDVIVDVPTSSVALAVNEVVRDENALFLASGPATSDLTGSACSPHTVHWTYDTWSLAHGTGSAMVEQGGDTWFFITADYAFGHQLEEDTTEVVEEAGGEVLGAVRHPLSTSDFSSFLLQAQASGAEVIGLANAGGDTINSIKQASEFGIVQAGQSLAGLLMFSTDVAALGLDTAQGLVLTTGFDVDQNEATKEFSARFAERDGSNPTMVQAGVYSAVLHYLKGVEATGTDDADTVIEWMKANPTQDPVFGEASIREDGRHMHDMFLMEVNSPEEAQYEGDYFTVLATIPAEQAFRPLEEGNCAFVEADAGASSEEGAEKAAE
ncbi:MAG TPA: ABC transporter substrate-binding protein [Paracoccaceae bacterium]|nr:ABC transporter substrate-binding protein [Paracoccaceae bacterium]